MLGDFFVGNLFFTHINCRREKLFLHKFDVETKGRAKRTQFGVSNGCETHNHVNNVQQIHKACAVVKCHGVREKLLLPTHGISLSSFHFCAANGIDWMSLVSLTQASQALNDREKAESRKQFKHQSLSSI